MTTALAAIETNSILTLPARISTALNDVVTDGDWRRAAHLVADNAADAETVIRLFEPKFDDASGVFVTATATWTDLVAFFAKARVRDEHLECAYGPQYRQVLGALRRLAALTDAEIDAIGVAYIANRDRIEEVRLPMPIAQCADEKLGGWLYPATMRVDASVRAVAVALAERGGRWERHYCGLHPMIEGTAHALGYLTIRHRLRLPTQGYQVATISREDYDAMTAPWRDVLGSLHPDDSRRS